MAVSHTRRPRSKTRTYWRVLGQLCHPQLEGCASTKRTVARPPWVLAVLFSLPWVGGMPVHAQTSPYLATINQYRVTCHSATAKAGNLVLQGIDPSPAANPAIWEKILRKIRSGEMPPPGRPRPDVDTLRAITTSVVSQLDAAAERAPYAGRPVIRRLNRTEYGNAIRDLLAFDMPASAELPDDGIAGGFDNIGDALSISPVLLERYLRVARKITDLALGIGAASPVTDQFSQRRRSSSGRVRACPSVPAVGYLSGPIFQETVRHPLRAFLAGGPNLTPTEGVRFFQTRAIVKAAAHVRGDVPGRLRRTRGSCDRISDWRGRRSVDRSDPEASAVRPALDVLLDGRRVKRFDIAGATANELAQLPAGPPQLEYVEISGPYNSTGVGSTASRQRLFVCQPQRASQESACASKIVSALARRAFRRDVSGEDFKAISDGVPRRTIEEQLRRVDCCRSASCIVTPDFLFRLEFDSRATVPGEPFIR